VGSRAWCGRYRADTRWQREHDGAAQLGQRQAGASEGARYSAGGASNPERSLYVVLDVVMPPADTDAEKAAYGALRDAFKFDPRANFTGDST